MHNLRLGKQVKPIVPKCACIVALLATAGIAGLPAVAGEATDKIISASSILVFADDDVASESELEAIGGTRVRADDSSDAQAIGGTRVRANGLPDNVTIGPVEDIDWQTRTFSVLNQRIRLDALPTDLQEGSLITAIACEGSQEALLVTDGNKRFVQGVTEVTVTGQVEKADSSTATFIVNGIQIDYSGLLSDGDPRVITPGVRVLVRGVTY